MVICWWGMCTRLYILCGTYCCCSLGRNWKYRNMLYPVLEHLRVNGDKQKIIGGEEYNHFSVVRILSTLDDCCVLPLTSWLSQTKKEQSET